MNACREWREQVLEQALGAEPSTELTGHLEKCAACNSALVALREQAEGIDADVRRLVREVEPPAAFRGRLRAATADRPPRPARAALGLAAAAAAALLLFFLLPRDVEQEWSAPPELSALVEWTSPTASLLPAAEAPSSPTFGEFYFRLDSADPNGPRTPSEDNRGDDHEI